MKTIEIQNCTGCKDGKLKVNINGEKHVLRHLTYKLQVDDDKSFEIKAKYFWDVSPAYTFEPKDNMTLQILMNRQVINWTGVLSYVLLLATMTFTVFFEKGKILAYFPGLLFITILSIIKKKRTFVIREVNAEKNIEE